MLMKRETDVLVVQYPRGCTAIVWFDPVAGSITTSHAGLRATLRRGVQSWEGVLFCPTMGTPSWLRCMTICSSTGMRSSG